MNYMAEDSPHRSHPPDGELLHSEADSPDAVIFPPSLTDAPSHSDGPKDISFTNGLGLVIGVIIGSGIFASPGPMLALSRSVGVSLILWMASGAVALIGSLCYAELGVSIPQSGGEHAYMLRAYGLLPAFLFNWMAVVVTKPGSNAIIAVVFGEYTVRLMDAIGNALSGTEQIEKNGEDSNVWLWLPKFVAVLCVLLCSIAQGTSNRLATVAQDLLTALKMLVIVTIGCLGIVFSARGGPIVDENFGNHLFSATVVSPDGKGPSMGDIVLAFCSGLWAFDGWNNANFVAGELQNPSRDLPRILGIAVPTVTVCYLLTIVAYLSVLPASVVATSGTVALDFGLSSLGQSGAILIPLCVSLSTLGALSASLFTGARIVRAAARCGELPPYFATLHPVRQTPIHGIALQAVLTSVLVVLGNFNSLVAAFSAVAWTFYGCSVAGILKIRQADRERGELGGFRVWTPLIYIFIVLSLILVIVSIIQEPWSAGMGMLFLVAGIPVYFIVQRGNWRRTNESGGIYRSRRRSFGTEWLAMDALFDEALFDGTKKYGKTKKKKIYKTADIGASFSSSLNSNIRRKRPHFLHRSDSVVSDADSDIVKFESPITDISRFHEPLLDSERIHVRDRSSDASLFGLEGVEAD